MSTLSLRSINKIYPNGVQAVFDFNLDIKDKEFVVFVGPSGCGKSTTLRMIAGFESISTGRLYIDDLFVNNVEPKDRNIAMVFQNYALYPHMTVYENLQFALELRKISCPKLKETPDSLELLEQEKEIRKEIKLAKKKFIKNQNSSELLNTYSDLYVKLIAVHNKRLASMEREIGIDEETIKELTKENEINQNAIAKINKKIDKYHDDEAFVEAANNSIKQKETLIEENKHRIEYLQHNKVPLSVKRKLTKDEMDIKINETAFTIDLTKYLFRLPGALSGGQRQRVALGRAIVREPKVFLMDEPLSNLDAKLRVQTRGEIIKIHEKVGATTIYVTHDQTEAMTMADRIVVMKDGHIQQLGTPQEIYDNPENKFVASFMGNPAMNFINVTVDGNKLVIDGEQPVFVKLNKEQTDRLSAYNGKPILVGIRPEKISIKNKREDTILEQSFVIKYDYAESLGYETVAYGFINGQKIMAKYQTEGMPERNEDIKLFFNTQDLYFFDLETEKRI